jgi:parallel beta helix pectate lyase-like protein
MKSASIVVLGPALTLLAGLAVSSGRVHTISTAAAAATASVVPDAQAAPVAGTVTLSATSLDWGTVFLTPTLTEQVRLLTVTNESTAPLSLSLSPATGPSAALFSLKIGDPVTQLSPQQTALYAWGFRPTAVGEGSAPIRLTAVAFTVTVPLSAGVVALRAPGQDAPEPQPTSSASPPDGPRDPVGPDVPLSAAEAAAFERCVTVTTPSPPAINIDVQRACDRAAKEGIPVVFLPAGDYYFDSEVTIPAGITLVGEGARSVCRANKAHVLFVAKGKNIRLTRLKLLGKSTAWTADTDNQTQGLQLSGKNIRVDHCELLGFDIAAQFVSEATGQVDHCWIHHNRVIGGGYGVAILTGAYVLVMDNEFNDCRHMLASNGDIYKSGTHPTHWEFLHNHVYNVDPSSYQQSAVDTHSGFDGSFVIENNAFDAHPHEAIGILAGCGLIRGNQFRDLPIAVRMLSTPENGFVGIPHDITIEGNDFAGRIPKKYDITDAAVNITIDGSVVPSTYRPNAAPPDPAP